MARGRPFVVWGLGIGARARLAAGGLLWGLAGGRTRLLPNGGKAPQAVVMRGFLAGRAFRKRPTGLEPSVAWAAFCGFGRLRRGPGAFGRRRPAQGLRRGGIEFGEG